MPMKKKKKMCDEIVMIILEVDIEILKVSLCLGGQNETMDLGLKSGD